MSSIIGFYSAKSVRLSDVRLLCVYKFSVIKKYQETAVVPGNE